MTDAIDEAERLYLEAREAANSVSLDLHANKQQIADARAARDRMLEAYRDAVLTDIQKRTALLRTLLAELEAVRASIQTNPIGSALDRVNGVIGAVSDVLETSAGDAPEKGKEDA